MALDSSREKLSPAQLRVETAKRLWRVVHLQDPAMLDHVLTPALADPVQQSWMSAALYGCLRFYPRYQTQLLRYLKTPIKPTEGEVLSLLVLGMHQLEQMRVKEHAAINETVNACRLMQKDWAVKLLNGVLRNYQRDLVDQKFKTEVEQYAHPKWMIKQLKLDWPKNWRDILDANNQQAPMCLRVNLNKHSREEALKSLENTGLECQMHKSVPSAIVLNSPCDVSEIPGFSDGLFSVQDAAAQLAASLLVSEKDQSLSLDVLDACAAPGGKTGHLLERLSTDSGLTAIDISEKRLQRVNENIQRLGYGSRKNLQLTTSDVAKFAEQTGKLYDRILCDVPCTATGVIRRHPDIKVRRRPKDLQIVSETQANILRSLWSILKPGGKLLYATCSVFKNENEVQIEKFMQSRDAAKLIPLNIDNAENTEFGSQILPGSEGMDGFFYALIEK